MHAIAALAFLGTITAIAASDHDQPSENDWEASLAMAQKRYNAVHGRTGRTTSNSNEGSMLAVTGTLECTTKDATPEMTHNLGAFLCLPPPTPPASTFRAPTVLACPPTFLNNI